jgi:PAS domain S-box-containing protein
MPEAIEKQDHATTPLPDKGDARKDTDLNNSKLVPQPHQALRDNDQLFRLMVDGVKDYAIFALDPAGNVVSWNTGAQNIKGYLAAEVIGTHFSRFYTPEDLLRKWPERELEVARSTGRMEDEGWRVRKDGTRFWANVVITALFDSEGALIGFAKVTRDLTAHRKMEAMEESGRQLNEFLAMLAHELRNPLAAIVNSVALMRISQGRENGNAQDVIDRQVSHLVRIVDDLLDVSRITRGKIALKTEVLDLNETVNRIVESLRTAIEARGHEVELHLAPNLAPIHADPTRLSQVVVNLVNNAVKYTPAGGRITITTASEPFEVELRVRDNGMGISADLLPRVFDLFVQGEPTLSRSESGLGIGLTLVKRLTELQGGTVEAASGGFGKGSEFILRMPRAIDREIPQAPVLPVAASATTRRRLLIVDDNRDTAKSLAAVLELMGHEVRTAHDGKSALSLAPEFQPDAIFLDIGLPGMNGYEVAPKFRELPHLGSVFLIAFTGYGQDQDRRRIRESGFDRHVVKPIRAMDLAKIIEDLPVQ